MRCRPSGASGCPACLSSAAAQPRPTSAWRGQTGREPSDPPGGSSPRSSAGSETPQSKVKGKGKGKFLHITVPNPLDLSKHVYLCRRNNTSQELIESGQLSDTFIHSKNHSKHAGTDYELYTELYSAITFKN